MLVADQSMMMRCVDDVDIGLLSIQVGLKVAMRWGCEFLISIVDLGRKSRKLGNRGRGGQRYVSRVRPRKQDAVDTMGTMEYRGAGEFRAPVALRFPVSGQGERKSQETRDMGSGVPNKRNNNDNGTHAPVKKVKKSTPHRYVPLMYPGSPHPGRNNGNGTCNRDRRKDRARGIAGNHLTEVDNTFWITKHTSQKGFA